MSFIFISLGIGILIGYVRPLSVGVGKVARGLTMAGLFIMLLAMGAQLGGNENVTGTFARMGFQAVTLAGFSVLGSILAIFLARNYIYRDMAEKLTRWHGGKKQ